MQRSRANDWIDSRFPESLFQPAENQRASYNKRLVSGFKTAQKSNVIICGMCRDIEDTAYKTISRIERLSSFFNSSYIVIYENDSNDKTPEILKDWQESNDSVTVFSEVIGTKRLEDTSVERCHIMKDARNKLQNEVKILESSIYLDIDFVILVDMDLIGGWSYEGILNSLSYTHWDFIGSNGLHYGTVNKEGLLTNNLEEIARIDRIFFDTFAYKDVGETAQVRKSSSEKNKIRLGRGEEPYRVESCFGGLGIYRWNAYKVGQYDMYACDHVCFNESIAREGFKSIYINPSMITLYTETPYTK